MPGNSGIMASFGPLVTPCASDLSLTCIDPGKPNPEAVLEMPTGAAEAASWEVAGIMFVVLAFCSTLAFRRRHREKQKAEASRAKLREDGRKFAFDLARRLAPSAAMGKQRFFRGMQPKTTPVSLEFDELSLRLPGREKPVLEGVTGGFQGGEMAAVMGPSGAGKTTFLNTLCGKACQGEVRGQIRINGQASCIDGIKAATGFVPQDDVVHEHLTPHEQILFSAQLRNPVGTPAEKINLIVDDVVNVLQLTKVQHNVVGCIHRPGVSGGQRKRVNIGLELAACPSILFLDEPTTGLDSTVALAIVDSLKKLTQLGMTVIMSVHQPRFSLFTLFDTVLLLGVGGRTVYLGPSQSAVPYFEHLGFEVQENENPADWLMDAISGAVPNSNPGFSQADLFASWRLADNPTWSLQATEEGLSQSLPTTESNEEDDDGAAALRQALEAEWIRMEFPGESFASVAEVRSMLSNICGKQEDEVGDLFKTMAGKDGHIHMSVFLDLFAALEGHNFNGKADDLHRETPGCFAQFAILVPRDLVRFMRQGRQKVYNIVLTLIASVAFGFTSMGKSSVAHGQMAIKVNNAHVALGVVMAVSCLNIFGSDRTLFWRERAAGVKVMAFFLARILVAAFDVAGLCLFYTLMWYLLARPADSFWLYYRYFGLTSLACAGWGVFISLLVKPASATLATCVVMLIMGAVLSDPQVIADGDSSWLHHLAGVSPFTWSTGATYLTAVRAHGGPGALPFSAGAMETGYRDALEHQHLDTQGLACTVLVLMGLVLFLLGYLALRFVQGPRQGHVPRAAARLASCCAAKTRLVPVIQRGGACANEDGDVA